MSNQNAEVIFPKCRNCGISADDKYKQEELIEEGITGNIEWYCDEFCASEESET